MITTDQANNQITAFHPGAMDESHLNPVSAVITEEAKTPKGPLNLASSRLMVAKECGNTSIN
jgi:adenosine kinase